MLKARNGSKVMKGMYTLILFITYFSCGMPLGEAHATTIQAKSCSYADVSSAVSSASRGDTIAVPAGDCTWSNALSITKAVTLQGAGKGITKIKANVSSSNHLIYFKPSNPSDDANVDFKITGFTFDLAGANGIQMRTETTTALNRIIIGNNEFLNPGAVWATIKTIGNFYGVIYGNYFLGKASIIATGHSGSAMWNAMDGSVYGTLKNLVIEDNFIESKETPAEKVIVGSTGASYVFRYNTTKFNSSLYRYGGDTHGAQYSGSYATRSAEIYGNNWIIDGPGGFDFFMLRGGKGMFFNNRAIYTYDRLNAGSAGILMYEMYGDDHAGVPTSTTCPAWTLYPGSKTCAPDGTPQHPSSTYVWSNRFGYNSQNTPAVRNRWCYPARPDNGMNDDPCLQVNPYFPTLSDGVTPNINYARRLRPNVDFWVENDGGVGCGSSAPTGSCTAGSAYWVTENTGSCTDLTSLTGHDHASNINGTLYRCDPADNKWVPYYTPLTYPHPLRDRESRAVNPPKGFKVVSR